MAEILDPRADLTDVTKFRNVLQRYGFRGRDASDSPEPLEQAWTQPDSSRDLDNPLRFIDTFVDGRDVAAAEFASCVIGVNLIRSMYHGQEERYHKV